MDETHLVVQCASDKTGTQSILFTEWNVSLDYAMIDADTVSLSCFVINIDGQNTLIAECLEHSRWAEEFTHLP